MYTVHFVCSRGKKKPSKICTQQGCWGFVSVVCLPRRQPQGLKLDWKPIPKSSRAFLATPWHCQFEPVTRKHCSHPLPVEWYTQLGQSRARLVAAPSWDPRFAATRDSIPTKSTVPVIPKGYVVHLAI